jgi:hypothetical protein
MMGLYLRAIARCARLVDTPFGCDDESSGITQPIRSNMMKPFKLSIGVGALSSFALAAGVAVAEPVKLTKAEMDAVVAGAITPTHVNGGGNTPNGNANGVPVVNLNPAGKAPSGHNK